MTKENRRSDATATQDDIVRQLDILRDNLEALGDSLTAFAQQSLRDTAQAASDAEKGCINGAGAAAARAREYVRDATAELGVASSGLWEGVSTEVRRKPLQTLSLAVAAGTLIGVLMRSR